MGEDERNDSLFILTGIKAGYIPATEVSIIDCLYELPKVDKPDHKSDFEIFIEVSLREMSPAIRKMVLGRKADNNWRKIHGLPMRRKKCSRR